MSKAYTSEDNTVKVIECYKLGLNTREISRQTDINPVTISLRLTIFQSCLDIFLNGSYTDLLEKHGILFL